MRAEIRYFHSPDAIDLDGYNPEDPEDDAILLQVMAGATGGTGEESFDIVVCTPRWVERLVKRQGPLIGRHYLIVESMNLTVVRRFLTKIMEAETADDWERLANRLGRIGRWEFEDYRP